MSKANKKSEIETTEADENVLALMRANERGQLKVVKALVAEGADINAKNMVGGALRS